MGLVLVACATAALALTRPATIHVERTGHVRAAPEVVYRSVSDFGGWRSWSPWRELTQHCDGPTTGVGATCGGGTARLTIAALDPNRSVGITLSFPRQSSESARLTIRLAPADSGTDVTWTFDAPRAFGEQTLGGPRDWESHLGPRFEEGLRGLDAATTE